jgi:tetratricopeptide (TPR) repeat protein
MRKRLQTIKRISILLGIGVLFSSLLYAVLTIIGISENISLLIAFLTLVGILVTLLLIYCLSFLLKQSQSGTSGVASRREFLRGAAAMSAITLATRPFLDEPALQNDEPALPKASNLPIGLAIALAQAQEWQEAKPIRYSPGSLWSRATALQELASALAQAQEWQEAERVTRSIEEDWGYADALRKLASALAQAGEREQAQPLWQEAERVARSLEEDWSRATALQELASALAQAQEWQEAERVARSLEDKTNRAHALEELAIALAQAQEWQEAERVTRSIETDWSRPRALRKLASALAQVGEREQAQPLWQEAGRVALSSIENDRDKAAALLAIALAQAQEWQEAERVILSIPPRSSPPPRKEPSIASLDWGDLVSKVFDKIAGVASIIALLDAVERRWRERSTTNDAHPHQVASQSSETDIVAIRLRMTHGPDHQFEEWLTDPDKLKHYIDVFNQPSSTILPLKVVFVQRNGKELSVDVLKGTQNNPQLDELLSYLNTNSEQK